MNKATVTVIIAAVLSLAFAAWVVSNATSSKKKNAAPAVAHTSQPTPAVAGVTFAQVFNRTPPTTLQVTSIGKCAQNPSDATVYACDFGVTKVATGQKICAAVSFSLNATTNKIKYLQSVRVADKYCTTTA